VLKSGEHDVKSFLGCWREVFSAFAKRPPIFAAAAPPDTASRWYKNAFRAGANSGAEKGGPGRFSHVRRRGRVPFFGRGGTKFMRALIMVAVLMAAGASRAADVDVMDGYTLRLSGTTFRLDGIATPERDQVCLDENGAVWACGIGAVNRLTDLTAKRAVQCEDKGPDPVYPSRRIGVCSVEGMILKDRKSVV
jgi:endonuclease YncB( thermonuclease family)